MPLLKPPCTYNATTYMRSRNIMSFFCNAWRKAGCFIGYNNYLAKSGAKGCPRCNNRDKSYQPHCNGCKKLQSLVVTNSMPAMFPDACNLHILLLGFYIGKAISSIRWRARLAL